ncbi:MAG TPA: cytochrome c [Devosia sp.]|jgi:mono/diheme cytochrome c family protein|nr:cytochrome c [Devosia sp.]
MRAWRWVVILVVLVGAGIGIYMLTPVTGPARDLTLAGDATRGEYLIRLGGCISCHTDRENGGVELAGGAGLATPFGTFYPPNITSSQTAGIGGWTLAQFSKAMSDGEGPEGHLYPAFPYDSYTLMSDGEIADLHAALLARPADDTPSRPHEVGFPFNIRLAMAGWKHLFFRPQRYVADPSQSAEWNRGKYIVFGPGHCVTCHSPRNLLGGISPGSELAGSPGGTPGGRAPSLRKADLEDHDYDVETLTQTLADGFTPGFDNFGGPMGEVIRDETSHWTADDRRAVATYLLSEAR